MISRLTSEAFIPSWPIAMPSPTAIVANSRGVPPAAAHAGLHVLRQPAEVDVAGHRLVAGVADGDDRLREVIVGQAHRVEVRAVGRALGALGHLPAPGLDVALGSLSSWRGLLCGKRNRGAAGLSSWQARPQMWTSVAQVRLLALEPSRHVGLVDV